MRFFLLMIFWGFVSLLLESTWFSDFPTEVVHFDLVVVTVAAVSFYFEWQRALPIVISYGLLVDVYSHAPFGMAIFSFLIIYFFIRAIISKISFQSGVALLFWVGVVSLLDKLSCSIVVFVSTGKMTVPNIILHRAIPQAILDSVVALPLIPFLKWYWDLSWEKITRPKGLVLK